jgi:hypothetical protein
MLVSDYKNAWRCQDAAKKRIISPFASPKLLRRENLRIDLAADFIGDAAKQLCYLTQPDVAHDQ